MQEKRNHRMAGFFPLQTVGHVPLDFFGCSIYIRTYIFSSNSGFCMPKNSLSNSDQVPHILIVDDSRETLDVIDRMLSNSGYKTLLARSGEEAMDIIRKNQPDLILLDINMPDVDGFEVCRRLKSSADTRDVPVIFLTGRRETGDIVRGFHRGAVDYIQKPFHMTELLARVENHLEIRRGKEELKRLNASKDRFFSLVSHDIKDYMSTIMETTEYLCQNVNDMERSTIHWMSNQLHARAGNLYHLLENLLLWSRSQIGSLQFRREKVDIGALIMENMELMSPLAEAKKITLKSSVPKEAFAYIDENMIRTIIRNLLSNAIKFSNEEDAIQIECFVEEESLVITVRDEGVGISPQDVHQLFRIDTHHTTPGTGDEKGSGLGLILCRDFVERNKGRIWVESEEGRGSRFFFEIPRYKPQS